MSIAALTTLGAISGAQKDKSGGSTSNTSSVQLGAADSLENLGYNITEEQLKQLQSLFAQGPGAQDVQAGLDSTRGLADMLKQYSQGGFLPSQEDFSTANTFASQAFGGQQTALNQQFAQQQTDARRLAAQMNRPVNDPVLQAKLAQNQMNSQQQLSANQDSYASQFAQNLPGQRLGYAQQFADVNNSLASQALSNRQALLSLGSGIMDAGRTFRLNSATRTNNGTTTQYSGGGLAGAINGGMAGLSSGVNLSGQFMGAMTGGGGMGGFSQMGMGQAPRQNVSAGQTQSFAQQPQMAALPSAPNSFYRN